MKRKIAILIALCLLAALLVAGFAGCSKKAMDGINTSVKTTQETTSGVAKGEVYSSPEEVAEYIHLYDELPPNFITKNDAKDLGWKSNKGNLWEVTYKMSIGGDKFSNRERLLPKASDRQYYECDVNYYGGYRGAERLLYSNDGLIFYSDDHYETATQLY